MASSLGVAQPAMMLRTKYLVLLVIISASAVLRWFLLVFSSTEITGRSTTTAMAYGRPTPELAILVALEENTVATVLDKWSAFAQSTGAFVFVICGEKAKDGVVSRSHLSPLLVNQDSMWNEVFAQFTAQSTAAATLGVVGAGAVPGPGLEYARSAFSAIAAEKRPTVVLGRARWRTSSYSATGDRAHKNLGVRGGSGSSGKSGAKPGPGDWLPETFIAHAWFNRAMLRAEHTCDAGLDKLSVGEMPLNRVLSRLTAVGTRGDGVRGEAGAGVKVVGRYDNMQLVDGTDLLPVMMLPQATTVQVRGRDLSLWASHATGTTAAAGEISLEKSELEGPGVENKYDVPKEKEAKQKQDASFSSGGREGHAVFIGDLTLSLVPKTGFWRGANFVSIGRSSWPPRYLLDTVATERDGLVVVTNVNCGYLDMAANFLQSVRRTSWDTKVRT